MARLNQDNLVRARSLIALYPHKRSALIPLLHLLQEQDGYLSPDGMEHVAELVDLRPAEVRGTASFYDMFHLEPIGRYLVAVCTNIACMLAGAYELLDHLQDRLGVHPGGTTEDHMFTLEDAECLALCGNAPCLTVNWRFFGDMTPDGWDALAEDLREGRLAGEVPPHGTLCRVQRSVDLMAAGPATPTTPATPATPVRSAKPAKPARSAKPAVAGAAGPQAPRAPLDSHGQAVELGTSRTTPAVASTVLASASGEGTTAP